MSEVRIVSLNGLKARLRDVLDEDPELLARFDRALSSDDEDLIQEAMDELGRCPPLMRAKAHDAMIAWLFDPSDNSGLGDLPAVTAAMN